MAGLPDHAGRSFLFFFSSVPDVLGQQQWNPLHSKPLNTESGLLGQVGAPASHTEGPRFNALHHL